MIRAAWMEKTMSKSNGTSSIGTLEDQGTLASESDAVTGGDIQITEDELKQVTGGAVRLPGLHKASDVTFKRGTI
jgi:bacteriocin-like protein